MRRLCVGDIHGCYDELMTALDNCAYSDSDVLYSVGDFTDRGTQNVQVLDFLMGLENFHPVCGNHDLWNYEYLHPPVENKYGIYHYMTRDAFECWYGWNGGRNTTHEEHDKSREWKDKVYAFLKDIPYRINLGDKVIIHSVCPPSVYKWVTEDLDEITMESLKTSGLITDPVYDDRVWNRQVIGACADYYSIGGKKEFDQYYKDHFSEGYSGSPVYIIGHTPLDHPFYDRELGIIGIDTGAFCSSKRGWGYDGYLTVLDIDSLEYWTSKDKKVDRL